MNRRDTVALFSLADGLDTKLMKLGAICAAVTGLAQSLMAIYFGKIFNIFGASSDPSNIVSDLTKLCISRVGILSYRNSHSIVSPSYGLTVWFGSKLIIEKGYNGEQVVTIMFAIMFCRGYLEDASSCFIAIFVGNAAAYKMIQGIKRKPQIDSYDTNGIVPQEIKGDIELKDVYFSYPARPDVQIFSGLSLFVPYGTTAALVGQSGSGKSTVISLIERFYDPQDGEVLIDGINLKNLQLKWIREKIGLVSSEPILFTTTIKENIAYGKENCNSNLKNPKILLLDEAISALDVESKRIVQDALIQIKSNRIVHGLSFFVLYFSYVLFFNMGAQLVQQGKATFPEVLK
ncbi:Lipid A export ATP-binding/permease protein MsbA, partial [Thalictrum thalictroides]